jgi:hypothetical protein
MKTAAGIAGALVIATISGAGGYFMGKEKSAVNPTVGSAREDSGRVKRSGLPAVNPKELRARLDGERNPLARFKLALSNLEAWVAKDPQDALNWLAGQPPSDRRDEVIRMALSQFSDINAKGAADWAMKNLTGSDLNNALIAIAENWALQDGREAAAWFLGLPATQERDGAVENLFFTWATDEPAAAMDFLASNAGTGDLGPTLRRASLAGWAKSDPEGAVSASLALSRTHNDTAQFANTLANWATMDLEASSQWLLANLPAGNERTVAAQELAIIFAQQSPEAGIAWLEKLGTGSERDAAASALVAAWARSGPAEAVKWAANQKSSTLSPEAISEAARNFMLKDAAGFLSWRAALPEGPLKKLAEQAGVMAEGDD